MAITKTNFTPIDKVLLSMPQPLIDEIITEGGLKLFIDPTYNSEFHATVEGTVVGLPKNPKSKGKEVVKELSIGDEVAFNYKVVVDKKMTPNSGKFDAITDTPHSKVFVNNKRERLIITALRYKGNTIWTGLFLDKNGERIDGIQGRESEIERWRSQFDFSTETKFIYKNLLTHDDVDLWQADYVHIYAKKTADGIKAIGDRVLMKEIKVDITEQVKILNGIEIPDGQVIAELKDKATVVSGGEAYGIKPGDIVYFDALYVEKYKFFGEEYLIIKDRRIHSIMDKLN